MPKPDPKTSKSSTGDVIHRHLEDEEGDLTSPAQAKMEAASEQPKKRYLLLGGAHVENEWKDGVHTTTTYDASVPGNNIVESHRDLVTIFGANRFKLIDDNKVTLEDEDGNRKKNASREERNQASRDAINKVTEEEAAAYVANDPASKFPYSENAGFEQPPPKEERDNPVDVRKGEEKFPKDKK